MVNASVSGENAGRHVTPGCTGSAPKRDISARGPARRERTERAPKERLCRSRRSSPGRAVEMPASGNTLEDVLTGILEAETGAGDEIPDGLRHPYLARTG